MHRPFDPVTVTLRPVASRPLAVTTESAISASRWNAGRLLRCAGGSGRDGHSRQLVAQNFPGGIAR